MTDRQKLDSPVPDGNGNPDHDISADLELVAHLIDQSSLGSVPARHIRDGVEPAAVMALRERAGLELGVRGWSHVPESKVVLRGLGRFMPQPSGRTETVEATSPICAISNRGDIVHAQGAALNLPAKADGEPWYVYSATRGKRRCEFRLVVDDPSAPVVPEHVWELDVAMVWQVVDVDEVVRRRICRIDVDLIAAMRSCILPHLHEVCEPMGLATKVRMERDLEATLRSCGVLATVVTRPRWVRRLDGGSTSVEDLLSLMKQVQPHYTSEDYRDDIDQTLVEVNQSHAEQEQFCNAVFPMLLEALRVKEPDPDTAMVVARTALQRILREWDNIRGTDRVSHLASIAIQWLSGAVEHGSAAHGVQGVAPRR